MPFIRGLSNMGHLPEEWTTQSDRKMPFGHGTERDMGTHSFVDGQTRQYPRC